jgi:chromosome segregation ATPase
MIRFFSALWYLVSFQFLWASKKIESNPGVMQAEYDAVIRGKQKTARQISDAIKGVEAQRLKSLNDLATATKELEDLEEQKAGAIALAKKRTEKIGAEKAASDDEVQKYMALYNDACSTLAEKQKRIAMLEERVEQLQGAVSDHMIQLVQLKDEIETLASEKNEAVADVLANQEIANINQTMAGIKTDGSSGQLESLRQRRREAQAGVSISATLAGTDATLNRAKLKAAARTSVGNDDFLRAIGAKTAEAAAPAAPAPDTKLPE